MTGWRPAPRLLWGAAGWGGAAVFVIGAVALVAHTGNTAGPHRDRPAAHAEVGAAYSLFSTSNPRDPAGSVTVRVPSGTARITVLTRTDSAYRPEGGGSSAHDVSAPAGGRLVTVSTATQAPGSPGSPPLFAGAGGDRADVALVVDGRRYALPHRTPSYGTGFDGGDVAVGVGGHPRTYGLEVTFEGVTQTFDLTHHTHSLGRAAPLYRPPTARPGACGTATLTDGYTLDTGAVAASCVAQVRGVAWAPSVGWAPAGRLWPLVSARFVPPSGVRSARGTSYVVRPYDPDLRVTSGSHLFTPVSLALLPTAGLDDPVLHFVGPAPLDPAATVPVTIAAGERLFSQGRRHGGDSESATATVTWTAGLSL